MFKNKVKQAIRRQKRSIEKYPYSIEQNTNMDEMVNFVLNLLNKIAYKLVKN